MRATIRLTTPNTAILLAAGLMLALAGCNTIEGVGKDIRKAGEAIENAGEKGKK